MRIEQIGDWGEAHFREPTPPEAMQTVEASLGHPLPPELHELLSDTNGIEGEHGLGLVWTAERVASANAQCRSSAEFADIYMPIRWLGLLRGHRQR